ncbi:MAG: peptidoglycan bridge formation glycyltransferase FemA/FemB family protein, partial [bacterium]|nr:peptidoglycan bridge formation glycyltransferase FemA/FemB family protein [bacterium]
DPPLAETLNYPLSTPLVLRRALEPEWTWRTSLDGTDDALLARMHEKHRYNVRLAERRGVGVRRQPAPTMASGASATFGDDAWRLLQETARRQGISTHPRRYYETMLRELPQTTLYIAEREDEALAAAIVAYHGDTATYLHGGSSHAHRQHMAPHLLHWSAMRAARDAGMRWYDWGGVQPQIPDSRFQIPNSTWSGITRFKQGFGGEAVRHPPTRDLVFRPGWYRMLSWLARIRVR